MNVYIFFHDVDLIISQREYWGKHKSNEVEKNPP